MSKAQLHLPTELLPLVPRSLELRPGDYININHSTPSFKEWSSDPPKFSFGGKAFLDFEGRAIFAELLILKLLQREGWEGVWVSSFGGKFLVDMPISRRLENAIAPPAMCKKIPLVEGRLAGCFDICAWREDQLLFCEAKRKGRDAIRESQMRWIARAIECGLQNSLLIVEWKPKG